MIKFPDFPVETPESDINNRNGEFYTFVWQYCGEGSGDFDLKRTCFYYTGDMDDLLACVPASRVHFFVAAARHSLLRDLFLEGANEMAEAMLDGNFTSPQQWFDDHVFTEGWELVDMYKGMYHKALVDAVNKADLGK